MLRNVFAKTLWDRRRSILWWAVGSGAYMLIIVWSWSLFADPAQQQLFDQVLQSYPPEVWRLLGATPGESLLSPAGYLKVQAFGWLVPLLMLILGASIGGRAIAGEEEAKTMDLLLANPVSRAAIVVQKSVAMVILLAVLGLGVFAGTGVGVAAVGMDVGIGNLAAATLLALLVGCVFGALALAVGAATGRRGMSVGATSGAALATYLLTSVGPLAGWPAWTQKLSPFSYASAGNPLVDGMSWSDAGVLGGVVVVLVLAAVVSFDRRDVRL